MAELPRTFWLSRRAGAEGDDAWEVLTDPDLAAGASDYFEILECWRAADVPVVDWLIAVLHRINHSDLVVDAALKRFEEVAAVEPTRRAIGHVLDLAVFVAREQRADGSEPDRHSWIADRLSEHGEEAAPIGTREMLEQLTEVCPDCEGDDSGGGYDEPPSALASCTTCVGGRVPKSSTPKESANA